MNRETIVMGGLGSQLLAICQAEAPGPSRDLMLTEGSLENGLGAIQLKALDSQSTSNPKESQCKGGSGQRNGE